MVLNRATHHAYHKYDRLCSSENWELRELGFNVIISRFLFPEFQGYQRPTQHELIRKKEFMMVNKKLYVLQYTVTKFDAKVVNIYCFKTY